MLGNPDGSEHHARATYKTQKECSEENAGCHSSLEPHNLVLGSVGAHDYSRLYTFSMNANQKILAAAVIGVVIGAAGVMVCGAHRASLGERGHRMPDGTMMHGPLTMQGDMDGMMAGLTGKTGDEFDKVFLAEMIVHHQGAVAMAQAALKDAEHQEIKDLANAIIAAQTKEIKEMQDWQRAWYGQ